jgi:hypothetical protein
MVFEKNTLKEFNVLIVIPILYYDEHRGLREKEPQICTDYLAEQGSRERKKRGRILNHR